MEDATTVHYSAPTKAIHWVTAIIVLVAFIYGLGGSEEFAFASAIGTTVRPLLDPLQSVVCRAL
jgi:cytochrome b subunit of formate dehydrogenase